MSISAPTENDSNPRVRLDNPGKKCTKNGSGHTKTPRVIATHAGPFNILDVSISTMSSAGMNIPTPREPRSRFIIGAQSPSDE